MRSRGFFATRTPCGMQAAPSPVPQDRSLMRPGCYPESLRSSRWFRVRVFHTLTLAYMSNSLVRVSRRDGKNPFGKITVVPQASHTLSGLHLFWRRRLDFAQSLGKHSRSPRYALRTLVSFTASFSTISDLFTLFSKSFSSFPHGTSSLSVSSWYLALDKV